MKTRRYQPDAWPPASLVDSIEREIAPRGSEVGLVLGSGLGGIADALEDAWIGDANRIPGYPASTVAGHHGRLLLGRLPARPDGVGGGGDPSAARATASGGDTLRPWTWVVQGRVHLYEGHSPEYATRYVRLLHALGVRTLILTNAAGSVDPRVQPGDLVLAADAISLFFQPLARPGRSDQAERDAVWRSRAPLADPDLVRLAEEAAAEEGVSLQRGVLVGSLGPSYESAAEVRAWRRLGGTVASMSTLPEATQARELGMRLLLFSLVTNLGTGLSPQPLTHEEVVAVADRAGVTLGRVLIALVGRLAGR